MGDQEAVGTIVGNHRDQSSRVLEINWEIGSAPRRPGCCIGMLSRDESIGVGDSGSNGMRVGEFSVERRAMGNIQARASMKQKVERETMNERGLTCTSDLCVYSISMCMCVYIRVSKHICVWLAHIRLEPVVRSRTSIHFLRCKRIKRY